ncbi:MAG: SET domain-containing protein [Planctomycetia bacterium]
MPDSHQPSAHDTRAPHSSGSTGGQVLKPRRRREAADGFARLVKVGQTHVGRGVFARRWLAPGIVIGEIRGEVMDDHPEDSQYCMELRSGRLLEPGSPFRFVNHSCDPNCEIFYWDDDDPRQEDRLWLQTIRPIEPGEELLIDYCWPADAAIPCRCGAPNCRGWVVDPQELHLLEAMNRPADGDGGQPSR